jgi:hypothetical protein
MGTKMLNQILEQKTSTYKTGLGFDAYAHSKSHAPTISKPLGNGKFEIANETKKMVFKSAGIMSSSNQENVNATYTSQTKHKVKYTCSHCDKDGHLVQFCFRLAKQQKKEKAKARSNLRKAYSFVTRNMNGTKYEMLRKNTRFVPTFASHVSQYWIPKCLISNPSTEASTSCVSM